MADPGMEYTRTTKKSSVESEECNRDQNILLAVLNEKIDHINNDIQEIRKYQAVFVQNIDLIRMYNAKYPTPEDLAMAIKKIERHETYFALMATSVGIAWGLLLFIFNRLWVV